MIEGFVDVSLLEECLANEKVVLELVRKCSRITEELPVSYDLAQPFNSKRSEYGEKDEKDQCCQELEQFGDIK